MNEKGHAICELPNGKLIAGLKVQGDSQFNVTVPLRCPAPSRPVGLFHTHPGGKPVPSQQDINEGVRLGLELMCVQVPETGQTRCVLLPKRG